MILISHRGNINGKKPALENSPTYIEQASAAGYEVEIDVWFKDNKWWLGHDAPTYEISYDFFKRSFFWVHCKNVEALARLFKSEFINYFWHQTDNYTLTSYQYIWAYPGKLIIPESRSIAVLPEYQPKWDISNAIGVCSDFIEKYI